MHLLHAQTRCQKNLLRLRLLLLLVVVVWCMLRPFFRHLWMKVIANV
jgi:type II secretory pathway component PulM